MRCKSCQKSVSPKTSIKIGHTAVADYVRLCDLCFNSGGREVVEQHFGSLMTSKASAKPAKVHYDIHGSNERARESRRRGIERSAQLRREG